MDAIAQVVRVFEDKGIIHVANKVDPLGDIQTIMTELCLADLETVIKRRQTLAKEVKRGDKEAMVEDKVLAELEMVFGSQTSNWESGFQLARRAPKDLHLLTAKPMLYVFNASAATSNVVINSLVGKLHGEVVTVDPVFGTGLDELITASYKLLSLMTFFTTGLDETRAWTIKIGSVAPEAGAAIHSDFRERFIKAEVINWQTLLEVGSYAAARDRGLLRVEGRDYIVQDGDVIEFKI